MEYYDLLNVLRRGGLKVNNLKGGKT